MNTDFRILFEETLSYKGGKLYLMLLREDTRFGVEVVSREDTLGRKYTKDRKEADFLFESVSKNLSKYNVIKDAENSIKRCFSLNSIDKILFVLADVSSQKDIVSLKDKINFKTRVKIDYIKNKKEKDALTVYVYLDSEKIPFGVLIGTRKADDLVFELL